MNISAFERGQLAAFAYRHGRHSGNLEVMRAICFVMRNRFRSGCGDGSWLKVIDRHTDIAAWLPEEIDLDPSDRLLQLLLREVDDIYLGQDHGEDATRNVACGQMSHPEMRDGALGVSRGSNLPLFFAFVDKPICEWFGTNIVRQPRDHAQVGNIGTMLLYL